MAGKDVIFDLVVAVFLTAAVAVAWYLLFPGSLFVFFLFVPFAALARWLRKRWQRRDYPDGWPGE